MRALALLVLLAAVPAAAHDFWANGKEVDPVTKRVCCGQSDAKLLDQTEVHIVPGGYELDDTGEVVPYDHAQPSVDGRYWVFRWGGGTQCFFAPFNGT
jgi:hypothetical protein